MELKQNDLEHLQNMMAQGKMTADQANVEKVKMQRVHLVTSKIMAKVRKALNEAVKKGELCHLKKDGKKPEAYYHPEFEYLAKQERGDHEQRHILALRNFAKVSFESMQPLKD